MQTLAVGSWQIEADAPTTAQVHARIRVGAPEECGCAACRNFVAARDLAYPQDACDLFRTLGIQRDRETEVCCVGDLLEERVFYMGWYHFVGRILAGPPFEPGSATSQSAIVSELVFHPLTKSFGILFRPETDVLPKEFGDRPVVQLDFTTEVPWVLSEQPDSTHGLGERG